MYIVPWASVENSEAQWLHCRVPDLAEQISSSHYAKFCTWPRNIPLRGTALFKKLTAAEAIKKYQQSLPSSGMLRGVEW
jgi:hypothetical protein